MISNGPYTGLSVLDYRKLQQQWNSDQRQAAKKKLLRMQDQARANGTAIPHDLPTRGVGTRVPASELPKFPKWATRYEVNEEEEESSKPKSKSKHVKL